MNKLNICVFILGVISSVLAEAPLTSGPYPAPAPVYGPPRIIETPAPYPPAVPAPVYGPPEEIIVPPPKIVSNYDYAVYTPKRVEVLAPYAPPAPIIKTAPYAPAVPTPVYGPPAEIIVPPPKIVSNYDYAVYTPKRVEILAPYAPPAPIIKTAPYAPPAPIIEYARPAIPIAYNYNYDLPKIIPAPAPVLPTPLYGPPKIVEPIVPEPVYGVPEIYRAPTPVLTSYNYPVYAPRPVVVKTGPYPAPAPFVKIPETPVVPHTQYGVPF